LTRQRQHDIDAKTSAISILGRDLATMKANDALGDGQSKAGPTRVAISRIGDSVKRAEDVRQLRLGNAWSMVPDSHEGTPCAFLMRLANRYLDRGARRSVTDRIADDILDGTMQQLGIAMYSAVVARVELYRSILTLEFKLTIGNDV